MKRLRSLSPLWEPFSRRNVTIYAAGASFYLALSLLPTILLACSLLPYFPISASHWHELIEGTLPSSLRSIANYVLQTVYSRRSVAVLSASALTALWSASKGILAIMDGLNAILDFPLTSGYIRRRMLAILYYIVLSCSLLLMMMTLILGEALLRIVLSHLPGLYKWIMLFFRLRGLTSFLLLTALFSLIYRFLPTRKLPFKCCLHSAVLVSFGWILFSFAFSVYIRYISNSERFYGSIGLLLLFGIWLRFSISLLMYGGLYAGCKYKEGYYPLKIIKRWISSSE